MLFHDADAAGLGVFQAARERQVYAFGANGNQNEVAPDVVLASGVTDIPDAFLKIATEVRARTFHPAALELGMKDGMVRVLFNPRLLPRIPAATLDRARAAERDLISGKIAPADSATLKTTLGR